MRALLLLGLLGSCARPAPVDTARRDAVLAALAFPGQEPALEPRWSAPQPLSGDGRSWTVQVGSYAVREGLRAPALLLLPQGPWEAGVVVAHGHYGEGKNSAEAQDVAHHLAASGAAALVVDTPGVEEWDLPGRRIHLAEGAHGRALLAAGGTSALALQVEILRRGVDLLASLGASRIAATGASGGAVQSFWLALADPRVAGGALASTPPIPREARPGGCACDLLPGFPGPDPGILAMLDRPSLWMSELPQARPEGLPPSADFEVLEGPHSYNPEMIARALGWMRAELELPLDPVTLDPVPHVELHTGGPTEGPWRTLGELDLHPTRRWEPAARPGPPSEERCEGEGPAVLVAGPARGAEEALRALGLRACMLSLLDEDEAGQDEALARGEVYADRLAGTLQTAAARRGARGVWAARAWALPASGAGLPFVVQDPVSSLSFLDQNIDPPWIHVPGAWWGGMDGPLGRALARGEDPAELALALAEVLGLGAKKP